MIRRVLALLVLMTGIAAAQPGVRLDEAVRTALTSNPELQETLQEVGIARADVVAAGQVQNPRLDSSVRFPSLSGETVSTDVGLSFDFLDLALRSLRRKVAGVQLKQAEARVSEAVASLTARVEQAWYDVAAGQQIVALEQIVMDASQAASELAQRQFEAGNLSELDLGRQQAETTQLKLDVAKSEGELRLSQQRLRALLGDAPGEPLTVSGDLPDLPASDGDEAALETAAVEARPVVAAARLESQALQSQLDLQRKEAGLGEVRLGVDREVDAEGFTVTGPTLQIGLPLVHHNQGEMQRLEARLKQSEEHVRAVQQQVRLEVRTAFTEVEMARRQWDIDTHELIPIRSRIMQQSQLHYNTMLLSVYALLTDRQAEAVAHRQEIEAQRDYWKARAELHRAAPVKGETR